MEGEGLAVFSPGLNIGLMVMVVGGLLVIGLLQI